MTRRGIRTRSGIAVATCVLFIVGLASTGADAAQIGCSFHAPATIGLADIVQIPEPPDPVPSDVGFVLDTAEFLASAGCSAQFTCFVACDVQLQFFFGGTGLIGGEVRIIGFDQTSGLPFDAARATCGPTIGTLISGGCSGALNAPISGSGFFSLDCRAHGVVAVVVSGGCSGQIF